MSLKQLGSLYREVILDHAQNPHHQGELEHVSHFVTLENTSCGDIIHLQLEIDDQAVIKQVGFTGTGCTISQASASMMTDAIIGKTKIQALQMAQVFSNMMLNKECSQSELDQLQDAGILAVVVKFPARIKCATLAWWALQKSLKTDKGA
ncbi:Fe-S cluster assembly sulfur transfer protein SufU [Bombilactobacillus bombi]|uniref:Fe-S cluster assembly sulfur transfer protein SufU n=1 Tax=Bombilactobacillus bombi TaxID=1303590 RepID=UPI0015E624C6|nr:SUF system NifU family Fe-S cluster assembly protein [Bombilactobacillus bombi]MBA1434539.1 SUF system NifU family Fe-S cluster assembly protein [Bombilactobacillus bombi]